MIQLILLNPLAFACFARKRKRGRRREGRGGGEEKGREGGGGENQADLAGLSARGLT